MYCIPKGYWAKIAEGLERQSNAYRALKTVMAQVRTLLVKKKRNIFFCLFFFISFIFISMVGACVLNIIINIFSAK